MSIIILGPPGSGKGTQARLISQFFGLVVVDTGKLLRKAIDSNETLIKDINLGNLLSDDFVIRVLGDHLLTLDRDFILDGFPRTEFQAKSLLGFAVLKSRPVRCVIQMCIDDDLIIARLSTRFLCALCGATFSQQLKSCSQCSSGDIRRRGDDYDSNTVKHRIYQYERELPFLSEFFSGLGIKIIVVDASQSVEQVSQSIKKELF